jgi:cbb3-type cytochrome c oxidase subunit III
VATATATALLFAATASFAVAQDTKESVSRETSKPVIRGGIVFKTYCALCHGERGDGTGRAARLYGDLHLTITNRSPEYHEKIVRRGGQAVGSSAYMPPWQDELSEEQTEDVIAYLTIVGDAVRRGEVVYKTNCILCHGVEGDGKGRAASLFHPPPVDLTHSNKDEQYETAIIRLGGLAMGRSSGMPPWEERLTDTEIHDLVEYLRTLLVTLPEPSATPRRPQGSTMKFAPKS